MVIMILKGYFAVTIIIMLVYAIQHMVFAYNRAFGRQRLFYNEIMSSDMPTISILIPMHNEEKVLESAIEALLKCDYDRDRMEIIPINDNSTDKTRALLDGYHSRYEFIRPLHRESPNRGKPGGLNDAMKVAKGEIIILFDPDYRPSKNMLNQLALVFLDPEAGAVMGRVIPYNTNKNLLTRLFNLEQSGGDQADRRTRYNLGLIPQYGGTVGGFRKDLILETGGFDTDVLAEDTEIIFRFYTKGWKVVYANAAECYEEVPETWKDRGKQVRRWSRGHNKVCFRHLRPVLFSKDMYFREKLDGILLLFVYLMPFILALGLLDALTLFFLGEMNILSWWWVLLFLGVYNIFGNLAPFYEISSVLIADGAKRDVLLFPLITFSFYFYLWNVSLGFLDAMVDLATKRNVEWEKTARFVRNERKEAKK